MDFKKYAETNKQELPPNLEVGHQFEAISRIEENTFSLKGVETRGMRVFTEKGEFKTSSVPIMDTLRKYFAKNKEPLTGVRVVQPKGKRYLTLEGI
jgi:hypothetical protein